MTMSDKQEKALDWLLKKQVTYYNGKMSMSIMRAVEGDTEGHINLRVSHIASLLAEYAEKVKHEQQGQ